MEKKIELDNKVIKIFYKKNSVNQNIPVVILNLYDGNSEEIWNKTNELSNINYILVTISKIDWNKELSPWYMEKLFESENDYDGKADDYLNILINKIIPEIEKQINKELNKKVSYFALAGYSLAGMFSIYSLYKTDIFKRIICCSGSLWYPNFTHFIQDNDLKNLPDKIYFSLGDKESKTKNELMSKVEENTKLVYNYFNSMGIEAIYELNEGNHFQDITLRIAKGICWILK